MFRAAGVMAAGAASMMLWLRAADAPSATASVPAAQASVVSAPAAPSNSSAVPAATSAAAPSALAPGTGLVQLSGPSVPLSAARAADPRYNVLLIMSDDLNNWLGTYGHKLAKTPNLDKLASQGVRFDRAYCQYPLCCPSRSSMLTGKQPVSIRLYSNNVWFENFDPTLVSLPRIFRDNGYITLRTGKIFHGGMDDADGWVEGGEPRRGAGAAAILRDTLSIPTNRVMAAPAAPAPDASSIAVAPPARGTRGGRGGRRGGGSQDTPAGAARSDRWEATPDDVAGDNESGSAMRAMDYLNRYKDQVFFMGVGFSKPHSPLVAPKRFFDLYDLKDIELPLDFAASPTVPEGFPRGSIRPRNADLFIGRDATPEAAKEMIRAYLACISFMDWNVGRVLAELDRLGLREKTIVVFVSDHGYQLGEKGKWSKAGSLWEMGARVPMVIDMPGAKGDGQTSERIVQLLDVYPTLTELCKIPARYPLEGHSLVPLLNDPKAKWDYPAFTVWSENGQTPTGIVVRTEKWRYAEFTLGGTMLTDLQSDPHEVKNLAHDPQFAAVVKELSAVLRQYAGDQSPMGAADPLAVLPP